LTPARTQFVANDCLPPGDWTNRLPSAGRTPDAGSIAGQSLATAGSVRAAKSVSKCLTPKPFVTQCRLPPRSRPILAYQQGGIFSESKILHNCKLRLVCILRILRHNLFLYLYLRQLLCPLLRHILHRLLPHWLRLRLPHRQL